MSDDSEPKKFRDWFLTIFGGAIISTMAMLFVFVLSYLNNSTNAVKVDAEKWISQLRDDVSRNNQRVATIEGTLDAYSKEKTQELESIKNVQVKIEAIEKAFAGLDKDQCVCKERMDALGKLIEAAKETIRDVKTDIKADKPKEPLKPK